MTHKSTNLILRREFEENLKSLGELDNLNLKLTEAKEEVQKESNQKSFMAIEIRLFGEIFGTITDFNSALGMVLRSRVRI